MVLLNRRLLSICVLILLLLSSSGLLFCNASAQASLSIPIVVENDWMSRLENTSVYLDGSFQGLTDKHGQFVIQGVSPGQHNVTVTKDGFGSKTTDQEINSTTSLEFKLSPQKPANAVTIVALDARESRSHITGASVYVDDKFVGTTNTGEGSLTLDLSPGPHTVKISKDMLEDNTTQINVVPGSTYTFLMEGGARRYSILDGTLLTYSLTKEIEYGLVNTIKLSIIAYLVGLCIGLIMGIGRTSSNRIFRTAASVYVEGVRGLPLLLQLLFVFFGLPFLISDLTGQQINIDVFTSCIIALSVNSGAYMGEIFKAGIEAVNKGQTEAARSLGLSHNQALRYIILPQAFKIVLPALGNEFIALIKDSSIGLVISYTELTMEAKLIGVEYYNTFSPLLAAGIVYLCLTIPLGKAVQYMEKRYSLANTRTNGKAKKQKIKQLSEEFV